MNKTGGQERVAKAQRAIAHFQSIIGLYGMLGR
jgi:hypothetical protein